MKLHSYILAILTVLPLAGRCQDIRTDILFRQVPVEGLPSNTFTCIAQDERKFIWLGTEDGLVRYDGYRFKVYRPPADTRAVPDFKVGTICPGKDGALWLGTGGSGLVRFDPLTEQFTIYQHDPDDPNSISHNYIQEMLLDPDGVIWLGMLWTGLDRFDPATGQFQNFPLDPETPQGYYNTIRRVVLTNAYPNKLWLLTEDGSILSFDKSTFEFKPLLPNPKNPEMLSGNRIKGILADSRGILWVAGINSKGDAILKQVDQENGYFEEFSFNLEAPAPKKSKSLSYTLYEDRFGVLWFARGGGNYLSRYDPDTRHLEHILSDSEKRFALGHGLISGMVEDHTGVLWLCTLYGGLFKCHPGPPRVEHFYFRQDNVNSLPMLNIQSIAEDNQEKIWLGGPSTLNCLDLSDGSVKQFGGALPGENPDDPPVRLNPVKAIHEDTSGILWLGTQAYETGLVRFDQKSGTARRSGPSNAVRGMYLKQIFEGKDGAFYLGAVHDGLISRWDPSIPDQVELWDAPEDLGGEHDNWVLDIHQDDSGWIWAGMRLTGIKVINPATGKIIRRFRHDPQDPESLSSDQVQVLFQDSYQRLWVGTREGLNLYDPARNSFRQISDPRKTTVFDIRSILEDDDGNLWLATDEGITIIHAPPGVAPSFRHYLSLDGNRLDNVDFGINTSLKTRKGALAFGSQKAGLFIFHPDRIDIPPPPDVVLTDFRLFNQSVPYRADGGTLLRQPIDVAKEIILSYHDRVLTFEFAALDYNAPSTNEYAYRLEGFDEDWQYIGIRRNVTFTNLYPGEYNLRVKGSNYAGIWNEEGTSLRLVITPLWWQITWVRILGVMLLIAAAIALFFYRMASIRQEKAQLEEKVNERTQDLSSALDHLKTAQAELVKSEKLALLGRLAANVAHEINTPLGAVGASNENIAQSYEVLIHQFPELVRSISPESLEQFFGLLNAGVAHSIVLSAQERRKIKKDLKDFLQGAGVSQPHRTADTLTDIGVDQHLAATYIGLLKGPHQDLTLTCLYHLARLKINSRNIHHAIERSGKILFAMKGYVGNNNNKGGKEPVRIPESIDLVLTLYHNQYRHGVMLLRKYQDVPLISGNKDELNQVWTNLILNALQAMDYKGKLDISVRLDRTAQLAGMPAGEEKDFVVVSITDNGPGIPDEVLPHIFEPFFTTKAEGEGSGLGLDISLSIVKGHGGDITVHTRPGRTTFEVWLPVSA